MRRSLVAICVFVLLMCGSCALAQQGLGGNPKKGQAIYEQNCLRCHGAKLDGNGPDGRYLVVPRADFNSPHSRAKTDFELLIAISQGVLFSPMHGWRDRLNDEQIRDVLSFIRMVAPFLAIS